MSVPIPLLPHLPLSISHTGFGFLQLVLQNESILGDTSSCPSIQGEVGFPKGSLDFGISPRFVGVGLPGRARVMAIPKLVKNKFLLHESDLAHVPGSGQ